MNLEESFKIAVDLHTKGKISDAKKIYEEILQKQPDYYLAASNLGIVFSQLKDFNKAIELFKRTIKINPKYAPAYNNLGNIFFELNEFEKSLEQYKKAVQLDPKLTDAYNNLGNIYLKKENLDKAIESYKSAISINNGSNKYKPYYNLGNIYRELGNYKKSIDFYKKAIDINPNSVESYINLSISLNKIGNLKEAIKFCETALKKNPKSTMAMNNLGEYYQEIGREDLSINYYKKALEVEPNNLRSKWLLMNTFPVIYEKTEQINIFKDNFNTNLKNFENLTSKIESIDKEKVFNVLNSSTNFYLHYQGEDIVNLQKRYGTLVHKLTKYIYPQFHKEIKKNKSKKIAKVGFVSPFFYEHVISKLFKNWIIKLNKDKFEKFVYHIGTDTDHVTESIKENCFSFYQNTKLQKIINKIVLDKLDILIFLDIGMVPQMQILGSLKLAPLQCCAYGVPVTTGLSNIDYFLTGKIMETKISKEHYTEKLIELPDLGVDYDYPKYFNIDNKQNKKSDKFIFLSLQSNFKMLPQHDHIFFEIIKSNSNCKIWFITTKNEFIAEKFKKRISKICEKNNVKLNDHFAFFPQTTYENYLALINDSDVILDSFEWSGLNTSLEAISLNKPVITMPSIWMRSRHTYGILKILNLDELICNSKKDYVDLSAKLFRDSNFYEEIIKKIKANKKFLFNNLNTVKFLENFLLNSIDQKI